MGEVNNNSGNEILNSNIEFTKQDIYNIVDEIIDEYLKEFQRLEDKSNFSKYVKILKNLKNNKEKYIKINFEKEEYTAETIMLEEIVLYAKNFKYASKKGLKVTLTHEIKHFMGLDRDSNNLKLLKKAGIFYGKWDNVKNLIDSFEINTNISTIRRYMENLGFSLDGEGIEKLKKYYDDNYNNLSYNEKIEILNFLDLFEGNNKKITKQELIILLNKLVFNNIIIKFLTKNKVNLLKKDLS